MNVASEHHLRPVIRRWSCAAMACLVGLAGLGCAAGPGGGTPARAAATPPDDGRPAAETRTTAPSAAPPLAPAAGEPWTRVIADVPPERLDALAERALLRAFDGAPPVVPHEIDQISAGDCLRCHGQGPEADEKGAPKAPHALLATCTQCHIEEFSEYFEEVELTENAFQGRASPPGGHRAYLGAPPVIPHSTHMRSFCLSCHGPFGPPPLQNDHPERQSCLQCHAPSAWLDQRFE
jgi:cytochrome c-type protein NapB